jgi:hypothetical protein
MHDRNGSEIHEGDFVMSNRGGGEFRPPFIVGRANTLNPSAESCNLRVLYPTYGGFENAYATASQVEIVAKINGDDPA